MKLSKDFVPDRVSVIIITYNYSAYIEEAIKSVFAQGVNDIELIVVDDGSTDNTRSVLEPYRDQLIYVHQANSGQSAARNRGLSVCSGEYIQFLDSDDLLASGKIASQMNFLKRNPYIDIVVCPNKLFRKTDRRAVDRYHAESGGCSVNSWMFIFVTPILHRHTPFFLEGR